MLIGFQIMRMSPTEPTGPPQILQRPLQLPQPSAVVGSSLSTADPLQHTTSLPPHQFTFLSRELHGDSLYPSTQQQQQPINLSENAQERGNSSSFAHAQPVLAQSADQARLPFVLDAAASSASSAFRGSPNWPLAVNARGDDEQLRQQEQQQVVQHSHHQQQHGHHQPDVQAARYLPDFSQT